MSSINCPIARPPAPWERSTRPFLTIELAADRLLNAHATFLALRRGLRRLAEAPISPMRRAGALGRDHARAHRRIGRARRAEQLAIARLLDAAQDRAAFAGGIVLRRLRHQGEAPLRVKALVGRPQAQRAVGHLAETAPFEALAQFEHFGDFGLRLLVAEFGHRAHVLILDLVPAVVDLAHQHQDRLGDVERLEAGDDDRLLRTPRRRTR